MPVDERLEVGRKEVVFCHEVGEFIDGDDESFDGEFLAEVVEGLVSTVDSGHAVVEVVGDVPDELLALPIFGFLDRQEVDMRLVGTELLEEFGFPDATPTVDHVEVVAWRLERRVEASSSSVRS